MIAAINQWADVIFFSLYLVVVVALFGGHLLGNILTGRFYKRFFLWQWPLHEEIIPPAPKIMHAVHVICMILLAFSGFLIRFPVMDRTPYRYIHYVAMYVVGINFVARVYYAFIRDKKEFVLTLQDIKAIPATVMYYAFMASDKPHLAKYNPMQKLTYGVMFPVLMVLQGYTGLSLVWPKIFLFWAQPLVGFSGAVAYARIGHYIIAWLFIILTTVHVYLASTEGFNALLDFFGVVPAEHVSHGEGHEKHSGESYSGHGEEIHHKPSPHLPVEEGSPYPPTKPTGSDFDWKGGENI